MVSPRIGVVVPASSCPCQQVDALARGNGLAEIVVVLNGASGDHDCARLLKSVHNCRVVGVPYRLGPAAARNLGVRSLIDADIIAFLDSDDIVEPGWITKITDSIVSGDSLLAAGALRVSRGRHEAIVIPAVDYWHATGIFGGNFAIASDAFASIGGFDEQMRCCEDTDLGWRAQASGFPIAVVPDAVVAVQAPSLVDEVAQRFRWGWWSVQLLRKHELDYSSLPALREILRNLRTDGWARYPRIASAFMFLGQLVGRVFAPS